MILARIASRLYAVAHNIDSDRDTLRERWEIDVDLQIQQTTETLADLNTHFQRAEASVAEAIAIVERRLLHRP